MSRPNSITSMTTLDLFGFIRDAHAALLDGTADAFTRTVAEQAEVRLRKLDRSAAKTWRAMMATQGLLAF